MHRDLKLGNILLNPASQESLASQWQEAELKIIDFGFSTTRLEAEGCLGTPGHMSPH